MNDFRSYPPEGIIITISQAMIREKGYANWLRGFLDTMSREDWTYWMRQGSKPRHDILYVYLCIGGRIRYRANYVSAEGPGWMTFSDGKEMYARSWIVMTGPVAIPPRPVKMKGFRGFRYTHKLF